MQLLTAIIDALSGERSNLAEALFKAKVLAHRLGDSDLKQWVDSELSGYAEATELPSYRRLHTTLMAQVSNGYFVYDNHVLPVFHLDILI